MAFRKSRRLRRNLRKSRRNRKYGGGPEYGNLRLEEILSPVDNKIITDPNYEKRRQNFADFLRKNTQYKNPEFENIYHREIDSIQERMN